MNYTDLSWLPGYSFFGTSRTVASRWDYRARHDVCVCVYPYAPRCPFVQSSVMRVHLPLPLLAFIVYVN